MFGGGAKVENETDADQLLPHSNQIQLLDTFRMLGVVVFTTDLGLKFAYLFSSKFVSQFMYSLFLFFVWSRGVFIVLFHLYNFCMRFHRLSQELRKKQNNYEQSRP